jgi:hypothetical protein
VKLGYCKVSISPVRSENKDQSEIVSQLLFGEIIHIITIVGNWCKITTYADNYTGWIDVKHFKPLTEKECNRWLDGLGYENSIFRIISTPWGIQRIVKGSFVPFHENTTFNIGFDQFEFIDFPSEEKANSIFDVAKEYLNSPYLWGGKTPFGIDCSGLTQVVFRFFGINLPRDASQQVECGMEVDFCDIELGDVAFFQNKEGRIIHVGILDGLNSIIHASGCVRIDRITSEGILNNETNEMTHYLNCIKRF